MEKLIRAIFLTMFLAVIMPLAISAQSINGALTVTNLQISPNPISAGSNVVVTFQIYDSYSSTLNNINLQLQGVYPILNFSPVNSYLISEMSQGIYGGTDSYFSYNINIPKSTPAGTYTLNVLATYQTTEIGVGGSTETVTGSSIIPITFYVNGIPNITVTSEPSQISPGQLFSISLNVLNSGYGNAKNITISLLNTTAFTPVGAKTFNIGAISEDASTILTAQYQASKFITNGTYTIPLYVSYYTNTGKGYKSIINQTIGVVINNPNIIVNIISAQPETLYRGYNQTLELSVSNIGTGSANNVSLSFYPNQGINILSSVSNFFIGAIAPGQSITEPLLVSASNYTSNNASVSTRITYLSSNYKNSFVKDQNLTLHVASSSTFSISNGNYTLNPGSTAVPINFVITNTGNIDAQNIQLSLQSSYPITPVTTSYYIPNLKPGQSANLSFEVSVDSNGNLGTYPITIYETWKQPNGAAEQLYTGTNVYYAVVGTSSAGGSGGNNLYIIIVVIVIIAAIIIYRRKSSSKKKK